MLITKEQQQAMVDAYAKQYKSQDEVLGFIDGMSTMLEFICQKMINDIKNQTT
jgi:hypothetical protein